MKKTLAIIALALLAAALMVSAAGAAARPNTPATFRLLSGLPQTMTVGQSYTVTIQVTSTEAFRSAQAMPDDQFPGKGVVARGGDRSGAGTSSTLHVTFTAKSSTATLPGGTDQVAVLAGVRYPNGQTASQRFDFSVTVP
jgi:hypothetical protein